MSYANSIVEMFGININNMDKKEAVEACLNIINTSSTNSKCQYVVTPNVDHVLMLKGNDAFRKAYKDARLVLADGNPIVWTSKLKGKALRCTVPGSELVPDLFEQASSFNRVLKIFLLGAGPGVAKTAADKIHSKYDNVRVVGCDSPPFGFHNNIKENERIIKLVNQSKADILVIGLGAPKQELWIHQFRHKIKTPLAICAGAVIDFIAEEKHRAPLWVRKMACEWIHRLMTEPQRLGPRYIKGIFFFPIVILVELLQKNK